MEQPEISEADKEIDVRPARKYKRATMEDAERWLQKYKERNSILKIAKEEGVDPDTVSTWIKKLGVTLKQGQHFVAQPPLSLPDGLARQLTKGHEYILQLVKDRVWGIRTTESGVRQLRNYCRFVQLHYEGKGVEETGSALGLHRSTVLGWRRGTDQPYLAKAFCATIEQNLAPGHQFLPSLLGSGGNEMEEWIQVPTKVDDLEGLSRVISQTKVNDFATSRAGELGVPDISSLSVRLELFAYLLGFLLGDASKLGGDGERYNSVNVDLQLSLKHVSNLRLGEFVCLCVNSLGLRMGRIADKQPTGDSKFAQVPTGAYRWSSERSPLLAWMRDVCMGLDHTKTTSLDPVDMEWIFRMPRMFRLRFIQALADSDATVKKYEVIITSVPNADFTTRLARSIGATTAHTVHENGKPLRTMVNRREAASLPIFSEIARGYRYQRLMGLDEEG